jgi:tRNA pseudouridine38-40 synthase
MIRYFIHMAFDGSDYFGWQVQPHKPTLQQVMEHALSTLLERDIRLTGAGRTDTGVHASRFTAHFDLDPEPSPAGKSAAGLHDPGSERFLFRLNRFLPPDIVAFKIKEVPDTMHARFSATYRTYHYYISSVKPLFQRNYCHYIYGRLDTESIGRCCEVILETSDFTSFAKLHSDVHTHICSVQHAAWITEEQGHRFEITANRFLRNMVRSITGTLLEVGLGKLDLDGFRQIIKARDRGRAGASVPARGLFLVDIGYEDQELR